MVRESASHVLPPIGGYILTGQLRVTHAAHAPVILRHDLTSDFFGIAEREAGLPDYHTFNVFPISAKALARLRNVLADGPRFEIDTRHSAFGWIPRPKAYSPQFGMPVGQASLFANREERDAFMSDHPVRARAMLQKPVIIVGADEQDFSDSAKATVDQMAVAGLRYLNQLGDPQGITDELKLSLIAALTTWYSQHFTNKRSSELPPGILEL